MDYDSMNKDQLKDEAAARGLPVSGTVPELVQRLRDHDSDDLLGDSAKPAKSDAPSDVSAPVVANPAPSAEPAPPLRVYRAKYECPGELSTGVHQENLRRCWQEASDAGHSPRGGAFGAAMTGFATEGGKRYALYEINLRV